MAPARFIGLALLASACGGGSGPLVTNPGGDGRDDPGSTRDVPPRTADVPSDSCIACDVDYECAVGGVQVVTQIDLSTDGGECTGVVMDLVCSGSLFGTSSCTGVAGGSFTCGAVTCTPITSVPFPSGDVDAGFGNGGGSG